MSLNLPYLIINAIISSHLVAITIESREGEGKPEIVASFTMKRSVYFVLRSALSTADLLSTCRVKLTEIPIQPSTLNPKET